MILSLEARQTRTSSPVRYQPMLACPGTATDLSGVVVYLLPTRGDGFGLGLHQSFGRDFICFCFDYGVTSR